MHLRKLTLTSFATHDKTEVALPERGLVSLTGNNGAGKSTLLEAVATGLWGESLRGEMGWREGQPGAVTVETDALLATRKRSKSGTAKLEWAPLQGDAVTYETTSKAQAALEASIGSYDVWRRTCVLSSMDSAAFSLARDSDRKRLLEEFLGLGMFDTALEACRKDRRTATNKAQQAEANLKELNLRLSFAQQQLEHAQNDRLAMLAETGGADAEHLKTEGRRVADLTSTAKASMEATAQRIAMLERSGMEHHAMLKAEKVRLANLKADQCPTCGQGTHTARQHLEMAIAETQKKADAHQDKIETELAALREDHAELADEYRRLDIKLQKLRSEYAVAESQAKQRASISDKIAKATQDVAHWTAALAEQGTGVEDAAKDAAYLEAVEQVLGLRGVRAQVLDQALSALEQQANNWLGRLPTEAGVLALSLTGSTTQKNGATVDAISLRVQGRPYAALSGGERRRVDVAILLALRELAVSAHNRDGTLLCDEVFDALDQQGQVDVAAALREMADDRMVLVISHSPELVKALNPDLRLNVVLQDGVAKVKVFS